MRGYISGEGIGVMITVLESHEQKGDRKKGLVNVGREE